jgi:hypothetical protein
MPQALTATITSSGPASGAATSSTWMFFTPRKTAAFMA